MPRRKSTKPLIRPDAYGIVHTYKDYPILPATNNDEALRPLGDGTARLVLWSPNNSVIATAKVETPLSVNSNDLKVSVTVRSFKGVDRFAFVLPIRGIPVEIYTVSLSQIQESTDGLVHGIMWELKTA